MRARRIAVWALAGATLVGAWWLGQQAALRVTAATAPDVPTPGAASVDAAGGRLPSTAHAAGTGTGATSPADHAPPPPMPPPDARLVDAWPALLARAEAGDRVAACRLAVLGMRCIAADWESEPTPTVDEIAALGPEARTDAIRQAAFALEHLAPLQPPCEGVDGALLQSLPTVMYRAARGSDDPHALAVFAEGVAAGRYGLFDDAGRRLYREQGAWAIDRLVARGEPHGLYLLWIASGRGHRGRPGAVMAMDEITSVAAQEMLREANRGSPSRERSPAWSRLDPNRQTLAEARLAELRERFGRDAEEGAARPVGRALMSSLSPLGTPPDGIADYCEAAVGTPATAPTP